MPKSKRDKKVSLTKTKKKGLEMKQNLISEIRECVDIYPRIFLFSMDNMRNAKLKDIRAAWKHSRFFFGKNKVMSIALGKDQSSEYKDGLHQLSRSLRGQRGLLFTAKETDETLSWFSEFCEPEFARSGNTAIQRVTIAAGPVPQFSHSMEPQLRRLGLPTTLKRGIINLREEYRVCNKGDVLTPEQAQILKLFGHQMAEVRVRLERVWNRDDCTCKQLNTDVPSSQASSVKVSVVKIEGEDVFEYEAVDEDDSDSDGQSDHSMES